MQHQGSRHARNDSCDPVYRGYKRFFRKMRNIAIVLMALVFVLIAFGIPSIQGDYRYPRGVKGTPTAMDKTNADYWNPVSGWQTVRAGEISRGCPIIIFMPLRKCMALEPYKNDFTTQVFGEEFFDGP